MVLISQHDLPVLNNVLKKTLPHVHPKGHRQVAQYKLLPNTSEVLPQNIIEPDNPILQILR